jgi:hypothetical protein
MFNQFLLVAAIASLTLATSPRAHCEYGWSAACPPGRVRLRCILMQLNLPRA